MLAPVACSPIKCSLSLTPGCYNHTQAEAHAKQLAGQVHGLEGRAKLQEAHAREMHAKLAAAEARLTSHKLDPASQDSGSLDMRDAARQVLLAQV